MATAEFSNTGKMIGYDSDLYNSILEQITKLTPDGDPLFEGEGNPNRSDYALMFAGIAEKILLDTGVAPKIVQVSVNGIVMIWDGTTNSLTAQGDDFYSFARAFTGGAVATGVGYLAGFTPKSR